MKKKIIICLAAILSIGLSLTATAQDAPKADHIALYVKDMDKSVAFYVQTPSRSFSQ